MSEKKNELETLSSFPDRVIFLYNKKWKGTKRSFCARYNISKTTFYDVFNKRKDEYSDFVIERFARAFGVSIEFMRNGGSIPGYYKPSDLNISAVSEGRVSYGGSTGRRKKDMTAAVAKAEVEFRVDDAEEMLQIIMRIKYKDIFF